MSEILEGWKVIAAAMGRSQRWCRYMAQRAVNPLPVSRIGGVIALRVDDLARWLDQEIAEHASLTGRQMRGRPATLWLEPEAMRRLEARCAGSGRSKTDELTRIVEEALYAPNGCNVEAAS